MHHLAPWRFGFFLDLRGCLITFGFKGWGSNPSEDLDLKSGHPWNLRSVSNPGGVWDGVRNEPPFGFRPFENHPVHPSTLPETNIFSAYSLALPHSSPVSFGRLFSPYGPLWPRAAPFAASQAASAESLSRIRAPFITTATRVECLLC